MDKNNNLKYELDQRNASNEWDQKISQKVIGEIRYKKIKTYTTVFFLIFFLFSFSLFYASDIADIFFEQESISLITEESNYFVTLSEYFEE